MPFSSRAIAKRFQKAFSKPEGYPGKAICCVYCGQSTGTLRRLSEGRYAHEDCQAVKGGRL